MKKYLALALAVVFALVLAGCGNSEGASTEEKQEIVVEDFGSFVDDIGNLHYAVKLKNVNEHWVSENPIITVSGKDASGNVVFGDRWVVKGLIPGEESYWANFLQTGGRTAEDIEVTVTTKEDFWHSGEAMAENVYAIDATDASITDRGRGTFTGDVTLLQDYDDYQQPLMVLVLRNAEGETIGGYSYVSEELKAGVPSKFMFNDCYLPEDYASFEVYADPWM